VWTGCAAVLLAACTGLIADPGDEPGGRGPGTPPGTPGRLAHVASESGARRLSQAELDNTLRDLLGETSSPAGRLLIEDDFAPYDNDYTLQNASAALISGLEVLSREVAASTTADPARRVRVVPCTPSGPGDAACFREFIEAFVPRAFRRPITEEEIAAYMTLQAFATEDNPYVDNDFYTAVELVISAVIQDPELLYRIERGTATDHDGVTRLGGHEIAARMSYLLWGTTPDDALLAAAADGSLEGAEGRRAQAERLLEDPRAHQQLYRFHAMWLGYRAIPHDAALVAQLNTETTALIDRVVFEGDRSYLELFTSNETYLTDALADHYGLPHPTGGEGWVLYGDTARAGILSHGSVLAGFSKFTDTSPTQRGIFVRTRLMCQDVPPPPPTVDVDQAPESADGSPCKWNRYSAHRAIASCANCHQRVDDIGFGLENFDVAGRFRTHDDGLPECTIEGRGEITDVGTFSGPAELSNLLVTEGYVDLCAIQHVYQFALGRAPYDAEAPVVDEMAAAFRAGGHSMRGFLIEYVSSDRFALRAEEAAP
jgi:hypothetical protein